MTNMLLTLTIAIVIVIAALALLGIGRIITGQTKLRGGMCGRVPSNKKGSDDCNPGGCGICGKSESEDKKDKK